MTTVISFVLGMMFGGAVGIIMAAVLMATREEAEPQTLCEDCKHFRRWVDTNTCFCDITEVEMLDDDYCSRAERRTDE